MVQISYDFMSKDCKHVLIQKVTFSTKKELLTQPYTRKPCTNTQKPMCTIVKQWCVNQPIFLEYKEINFSVSTQTVSPIYNNLLLNG